MVATTVSLVNMMGSIEYVIHSRCVDLNVVSSVDSVEDVS